MKGSGMLRTITILIALCVSASMAVPPIQEVLAKMEVNLKMTSDIKANVSLTQQKTNQGVKKIDVMYYRRDTDNSFLIVMVGPESEKGNGYLRIGENFWMYRRNTRTFQHINRDESIGGSDARGDDFETRNLTELYEGARDANGADKISEEMLGQIPVYRLEVKAKVSDIDYPRKTYWVRRDNALVLKEQAFALNGTLMQTAYYRKYTEIDGHYAPVEQYFIDEFEKGNKTIVQLSGLSTTKLDNAIFTKGYLENLSK
jgi:outer membrane lipoprotein-sorting protein